MADQPRPITIFDTTLRDGEQSPGCSMNRAEKLEVAQALADLRVDVIEAGFPIASPGDFEAVREIAEAVGGVQRLRPGPLQRQGHRPRRRGGQADAEAPRIHVFLATSAIHREFKLKMDKEEIIERADRRRRSAPATCATTSSSRPRTRPAPSPIFLCQVVEAAIDAGATTVNIPDTVGYATPAHMGARDQDARRPRAEHRQGGHQRPLPRRPGHGGRQQPGRRLRTAPGRSSARSTASASGPATARWKRS